MSVMGGLTAGQVGALLSPGGVYASGQRLGLPIAVGVLTTTAIAANTMYAWPIPVAVATLISGVAIQVGTAVASTSGKLGLALPDGANGWPGTLLAEAPSAVDTNSAADTELVAAFSANARVPAGFVWGLCVFNGLAQPITLGSLSVGGGGLGHYLGASHIGNYTGRSTGQSTRLSRSHTYASAFPSMLTGWAVTAGANPSSPIMVGVVA